MARGREDERALSAPRGPSETTAAELPAAPSGRPGRLRRIGVWTAVVAASLALLGSACPGIESIPSPDAEPVIGLDEDHLVRIPASAGPGVPPTRLVYDKETRWVSAKCAELFPRAAARLVPADYVETPAGLVPATKRSRPPIWR